MRESPVDRLRGTTKSYKKCSFCEKSVDRVNRLFSGVHDAYICDECIAYYYRLLAEIESGVVDPKSGRRISEDA